MKKLVGMLALAAFMFSMSVTAQEPKQEKKAKAKTEKSCCSSKKDKASCDDKAEKNRVIHQARKKDVVRLKNNFLKILKNVLVFKTFFFYLC